MTTKSDTAWTMGIIIGAYCISIITILVFVLFVLRWDYSNTTYICWWNWQQESWFNLKWVVYFHIALRASKPSSRIKGYNYHLGVANGSIVLFCRPLYKSKTRGGLSKILQKSFIEHCHTTDTGPIIWIFPYQESNPEAFMDAINKSLTHILSVHIFISDKATTA